jgi:hypothetical protein
MHNIILIQETKIILPIWVTQFLKLKLTCQRIQQSKAPALLNATTIVISTFDNPYARYIRRLQQNEVLCRAAYRICIFPNNVF